MSRTYQYLCGGCGFDVLSGAQVWECPHCGFELKLINIFNVEKPAQPDGRRVETAIDDVMRGFEKLLAEAANRPYDQEDDE